MQKISRIIKKSSVKLFICGIGGIGTSGLSLLAKSCGYQVCGSNEEENSNTEKLKKLGIDVKIKHKAENVRGNDIFVYTNAIDLSTNIEAIEAKALQMPMYDRGKMLAMLMKNYFNIVIAGSHGKTTTTGLIGNMLNKIGKKPNVLIGGVLNDSKTNCEIGKKYFVVESDESDGSFLGMPANIGVITNIDPEHMEFYKTIENLEYYFYRFAKKIVDNNGNIIVCIDDKVGKDLVKKLEKELNNKKNNNKKTKNKVKQVITYSAVNKKADFYCSNIKYRKDGIVFDVFNNINKTSEKNVFLSNMYGEINASNATTVFAVGYILNQNSGKIAKTFSQFAGIQKRFTICGECQKTLIVDDYAHNPQKIHSAIGSAKHYMKCNNLKGKLTIVFEPHRYTRVRDSIDLFADILKEADNVLVLPIYASSEQQIEGITQDFVVKKCKKHNKNVFSCELDVKKIKSKLKEIKAFEKDNLIVFMGAGRSSKLAHQIVEKSLNDK